MGRLRLALAALASVAAIGLAFWAGGLQAKLEAPQATPSLANQVAVAPAPSDAPSSRHATRASS